MMHNVQHKKEAFWFYRFLSIVYDDYVNPWFWSEAMRERALELGDWGNPALRTIDVGSGTGFTTCGIVRRVHASAVTCIDQSPHQMARARRKPELAECHFALGDAEELPVSTDSFDRYVSAGSIEYWPEPQRGICEAYRVLAPDGVALVVGPLRPAGRIVRALADAWMLFPEEGEYRAWFEAAGFVDIRTDIVAPEWVTQERYGLAIAGRKPTAGPSSLALPARKAEDLNAPMSWRDRLDFAGRLAVGTASGFAFLPVALAGTAVQALRKVRARGVS